MKLEKMFLKQHTTSEKFLTKILQQEDSINVSGNRTLTYDEPEKGIHGTTRHGNDSDKISNQNNIHKFRKFY